MILSQEQIDYCMECGVCTGSCPISRVIPTFSPRQMIKRALMDRDETLLHSKELWACLTCSRCSARCPVQIDFPDFARAYREQARKEGNLPQLSHHGTLQAIVSLQTRGAKQQRTDWAVDAGKFKDSGEYFYFVGCAPYHEAVLPYGGSSLEAARSVLKILNRIGIEPVISNDERCCGHDALWSGDEATFKKLAEKNLEVIRGSGAKKLIFSCPEGYATFKQHVPRYFGELPFEVLHMTELLVRELPGSSVSLKPAESGVPSEGGDNGGNSAGNGIVTYQDPCRLGRRAGIYEPPRELLRLLPDVRLEEMDRNRENSVCCGTSAWMECSSCSKAMQVERLQEALQTGAKTLITACPKCRIHFDCAKSNTDIELNIEDIYSFLLSRME